MSDLKFYLIETHLGWSGAVFSRTGLQTVTPPLPDKHAAIARIRIDPTLETPPDGAAATLIERLSRHLNGEQMTYGDIALDWHNAGEFTRAVLEAARSIPWGETRTYRWLAAAAGHPMAARAAGQVMARNPFAIVIPCHRVIASNGSLQGYSGGLEIKRRLLAIERLSLDTDAAPNAQHIAQALV